ncbi:hypothetical protein [Streptomyces sp. DH12]|uniref:hypothetical protein n=1 Tax=Streptomyces sp. DH12 TaxID=2857010 RepID=UPI001E3C52A7|nr:hypothetical protein [Streptomyces sp. DH12]
MATENTDPNETTEGTATEGGREKSDGASGPRPRVEWADDGGPRPDGVEAKVNDPRPTENSDAHDGAARDDGADQDQ